MAKTLWTQRHLAMRRVLRAIRVKRGFEQIELSRKLGKFDKFANKVENSARYLDYLEFLEWCDACGEDPAEVTRQIVEYKP